MSAGAFAVRLAAAGVGRGEYGNEDAERFDVFGGGQVREPVAGRVHADHHRRVGRGLHTGPRHPRTAVRSCNVRLHRVAGDFLQNLLPACRVEAGEPVHAGVQRAEPLGDLVDDPLGLAPEGAAVVAILGATDAETLTLEREWVDGIDIGKAVAYL